MLKLITQPHEIRTLTTDPNKIAGIYSNNKTLANRTWLILLLTSARHCPQWTNLIALNPQLFLHLILNYSTNLQLHEPWILDRHTLRSPWLWLIRQLEKEKRDGEGEEKETVREKQRAVRTMRETEILQIFNAILCF